MQAQPLKNERHEAFARAIVKGDKPREAYLAIYKCSERSADAAASRLLTDVKVRARVDYLKYRAAQRAEITAASLMQMAQDAFEQSLAKDQLSAAAQCIKELGILSGYRIERREQKSTRDVASMSDAEIMAMIAEARERRLSGQQSGQGMLAIEAKPLLSH